MFSPLVKIDNKVIRDFRFCSMFWLVIEDLWKDFKKCCPSPWKLLSNFESRSKRHEKSQLKLMIVLIGRLVGCMTISETHARILVFLLLFWSDWLNWPNFDSRIEKEKQQSFKYIMTFILAFKILIIFTCKTHIHSLYIIFPGDIVQSKNHDKNKINFNWEMQSRSDQSEPFFRIETDLEAKTENTKSWLNELLQTVVGDR